MDTNYYLNRYGGYADINLPKSYRVYFDPYCDEYQQYPIKKKLLDLAYVIIHGFDVKKAIKIILDTHAHISKRDIQRAVWSLTAAANHVESIADRRNSLETDVDIFIEDLLRCYRLPIDNSISHFLEEDFRVVSDQTVYRSNGWELASENINQYQMYKEDDFVFYPGDAELLQKYHQKDIDSGNIGQIFPIGPCPEPWYGNPLTAKIIILGDIPKYDDFISRCANMVLSCESRLMEHVQLIVRNWFSLSGVGMYCNTEYSLCPGLNISDAYNSLTYRHWVKEIRNLAWELDVEEQQLLDNICVINANAYYSMGGDDPLAAGILPSQYYLRVLVNYLVNNRKDRPIFIIPSTKLHKVWKKVLGYWIENEVMLTAEKIVINSSNTNLSLSSTILGKRNVYRIKDKIQDGIR